MVVMGDFNAKHCEWFRADLTKGASHKFAVFFLTVTHFETGGWVALVSDEKSQIAHFRQKKKEN